jgi:hypothetical protein
MPKCWSEIISKIKFICETKTIYTVSKYQWITEYGVWKDRMEITWQKNRNTIV